MYLVALYGVDEWITNPSQLELNSSFAATVILHPLNWQSPYNCINVRLIMRAFDL